MTFETTYAPFWIAVIIGVAALVTFFSYRRSSFNKPYSILLPVLRVFALSLIGILLLNPIVTETSVEEERPVLLWLQDESESVLMHRDSAMYRAEYQTWQADAVERLKDKYDVVEFGFGGQVTLPKHNFNQSESAIQEALRDASERLVGRNVGGVVLASDGILNSGSLLSNKQLVQPIHTLALGDSTQYFDVSISNVLHNRVAFTGNTTSIQVDLESKGGNVSSSVVQLHSVNPTQSQRVQFNRGKGRIIFDVSQDTSGIQRYVIEIEEVEGEKNTANNTTSIYIDFIEKKKSILWVYDAPHPDIAALRIPLLEDPANTVELVRFSEFSSEQIEGRDLIVFHGVNPNSDMEEILQKGEQNVLLITHPGRPYSDWELASAYLRQAPNLDRSDDVTVRFNPSFAPFQVNENWIESTSKFPPMRSEIHSQSSSGIWNPLLLANVGAIKTNTPILAIYNNGNQRVAWLNGEGWWKWRTYSYAEYGSHQMFDGFVNPLYRWLLTNSIGDRLEVDFPQQSRESENIPFTVRPKDASMNPIEDALVQLTLYHEGEVVSEQRLSEAGKGRYETFINGLKPGTYRYRVSSQFGEETLQKSGELFVDGISLESLDTKARFGVLEGLATSNDGVSATWNSRESLVEELLSLEASSKLHEVVTTESLLKKVWPYVLILLLLTLEWVLRKREGRI